VTDEMADFLVGAIDCYEESDLDDELSYCSV
jgi:hypothetical protein